MERLQKILSAAGIASRREAEKMILAGRVAVDGVVVRELGIKVDKETVEIKVDGNLVGARPEKRYFLLNKPTGYISAVKDDRGRRTVTDLLAREGEYIYPVGRLDYDTEGLLLLTNDGALMNGLLHPRYEVPKKYLAKVEGILQPEDIRTLQNGVLLEDGKTAPAKVRFMGVGDQDKWSRVEIVIHEGRNRQVRRMLLAVGHPVLKLERIGFAGLTLQGVKRGEYRALTREEIQALCRLAGCENS